MKHIILVKWKNELENKRELNEKAKAVFDKLVQIDGIHFVEYRENCVDRSNRFDLMIMINMDKAVLPVYDVSAPHLEWKEKFGKFLENKAIFDYEE